MNDYNKINGGFLSPDYIPIKERNKDEMINELKCEVNRLNNIINELEAWIRCSDEHYPKAIPFRETLRKLQELKESDNNE